MVDQRSDVTTIVVNWNTVDLLDDCLASIRDSTPDTVSNEIVVVDNASTDASVEHLRRRWPDVRVLVNSENQGFCRANNLAIRNTSAPVLLLVNTDARLASETVVTLLGYLERNPRTAVVGPRLVYGDGTFQRWTGGRLPTLSSMANFLFGLDRFALGRGRSLFLGQDTSRPFQPEWVSSAVMAVRRSALEEIGLLDERIFLYMDDVDLCARAIASGWQVWYAADTTAVHFMGASSKRKAGKASPEALRALNRWFARRHGRLAGHALRGLELGGFGARVLVHSFGVLRGSAEARALRASHISHFHLALEPIDA